MNARMNFIISQFLLYIIFIYIMPQPAKLYNIYNRANSHSQMKTMLVAYNRYYNTYMVLFFTSSLLSIRVSH
jgi:hypothetical protein